MTQLALAPRATQVYTARRAEIRQALNPEPSRDYSALSADDGEESDTVGGTNYSTNDDLRTDGRKKGPQHHKAFAAETAALTGQSKQEINRQLAVGKAIGEDLQCKAYTPAKQHVMDGVTGYGKYPENG